MDSEELKKSTPQQLRLKTKASLLRWCFRTEPSIQECIR